MRHENTASKHALLIPTFNAANELNMLVPMKIEKIVLDVIEYVCKQDSCVCKHFVLCIKAFEKLVNEKPYNSVLLFTYK